MTQWSTARRVSVIPSLKQLFLFVPKARYEELESIFRHINLNVPQSLDHVIEVFYGARGFFTYLIPSFQYLNDPQARKLVQDAKQDFGFNTNACLFTADVVTKIEKS
jgi:hypothetical protein